MSSRINRGAGRPAGAQGAETREIFSVSRLNEHARAVLEAQFGAVWVEGEISNLARPASGHIYFSLKDSNAQVRCAMFRRSNTRLGFEPRDGLSVHAHGRVSLYTARGDFQLIVDALEPAGEGMLRLRFEQLKRKLSAEGLFDAESKQDVPSWPRAIGIVTSTSGAAVRDILHVLARRCPSIPVIVYPTAVQGEGATAQITAAIGRAAARAEIDVLIVGRGGGSLEDLWCFNEEQVARAIHACPIPIVSAVGHEIDFTIADLVADVRAPTPSAAAELVSPDAREVTRRLSALGARLVSGVQSDLRARTRELNHLMRSLVSPRRRLEAHFQRLDELSQRLPIAVRTQLELRAGRVRALQAHMSAMSPTARIGLAQRELDHAQLRLNAAWHKQFTARSQALVRCEGMLRALGPASTLERGYAIVTDENGRVVNDAAGLSVDQRVSTRLARGRFDSRVVDTEDEPPPS